MKRFSTFLISLFLLASCAPTPSVTALTEPAATQSAPETTATSIPSSPTATTVSCDPFAADFCITDGHFILQRPILPPANDSVAATYRFGSTANGTREPHHGVEFINGTGIPVHAAADGEVIFAGPDEEAIYSPRADFYGNVVVIRHADDLFTLYAHLSVIDVQTGQEVEVGQKIGEVGRTGAAIGSHLHFEVRLGGDGRDYFSAQNPELWLNPKKERGVLAISVMDEAFEFQQAELTIQYYPGSATAPEKIYFVNTYATELAPVNENAVLGNLLPGHYRIALTAGGHFYERWVDVQAGKLTQVTIIIK